MGDIVDKIEETVTSMMLSLSDLTYPSHRDYAFRVSSLPFCPVKTFVAEPRNNNYQMSHYTEIGTAMHDIIQTWLALNPKYRKKIWGNWKCTGCQKVVEHRLHPSKPCDCKYKMSVGNSRLIGWPKFWNYEEVTITWKNLSGHVDLILFLNPTTAIVIDFKSSGLTEKKQSWYYKEDQPGSPSYVAQIRTYSSLLPITHDLPIKGWCLITVDRTRPIEDQHSFSPLSSEWGEDKQKRWMKYVQKSSDNYKLFEKLIEAVSDEDSDEANKQLKKCIVNRPCTDKKSYDTYMRYAFFGQKKCPLLKSCKKGKREVYSQVKSILNDRE